VDADGKNLHALSTAPCGYADIDPTWSPDGTTLVFAERGDTGEIRQSILHRIRADGTDRRPLLAGFPPFIGPDRWGRGRVEGDRQPSFTPDGSVLFAREGTSDGSGIYRVGLDGRGPKRLLADDPPCIFGAHPSAAPDGTIAFVRSADPADPMSDEIFLMKSDGTTVHRLTTVAPRREVTPRQPFTECGYGGLHEWIGADVAPTWSPDGTHLAVATNRNHRHDCFGFEIGVVDASTGAVRVITPHSTAATCEDHRGLWTDLDPAWR
jgi:Tol biopolymer transport system component